MIGLRLIILNSKKSKTNSSKRKNLKLSKVRNSGSLAYKATISSGIQNNGTIEDDTNQSSTNTSVFNNMKHSESQPLITPSSKGQKLSSRRTTIEDLKISQSLQAYTGRLESQNQLKLVENRLKRLEFEESRALKKIADSKRRADRFTQIRKSHEDNIKVKYDYLTMQEQIREQNHEKFLEQKQNNKSSINDSATQILDRKRSERDLLKQRYHKDLEIIQEDHIQHLNEKIKKKVILKRQV